MKERERKKRKGSEDDNDDWSSEAIAYHFDECSKWFQNDIDAVMTTSPRQRVQNKKENHKEQKKQLQMSQHIFTKFTKFVCFFLVLANWEPKFFGKPIEIYRIYIV